MADLQSDERRIIREVLAGDRDRFAELVRRHQARVLSLCASMMRNPAEAEDAAQEAFVKAYRNLRQFRLESSFSTWIYRIAYRACLDALRSRARKAEQPLDDEAARPPAAPPESASAEDAETLAGLLAELPPDYRAVLVLRERDGLSYVEIGRALDASLDSVKARLKRARRALRDAARHFSAEAGV